jgi:hypothetical protein
MPKRKINRQRSAKESTLSKLALINALKKSSPQIRSELIDYLNSKGLQILSESTHNILFNKDVPLTLSQKKKMKKYYQADKKNMREVSRKRASLTKKRNYFKKQSGGMLGALLGITNSKHSLRG